MSQKYQLILVDGSSYLFRAYYAMPPLTNSDGLFSGAIYGVINMLKKLLKDYPDTNIVVVFDSKGGTFRNDMYAEYKANRAQMPEDLAQQISPIHSIIKAMGFPLLLADRVEADDVIGTLAVSAAKENINTLISTGDKDLAQLVGDNITLINTMTEQLLDESGVIKKFGIKPCQMIDYLSLMGDASDNIPGIPKVGPKTAAKWLLEYQTLENLVGNADKIKGKVGESLRDNLSQLELSKSLVKIKLDVKLDVALADLAMSPPDTSELIKLYHKFEFKSWAQELINNDNNESNDSSVVVSSELPAPAKYDLVLTHEHCLRWIEKIKQAKVFALDVETTSLDDMNADLVGVSLAVTNGEAAYIPVAHTYENAPMQIQKEWLLDRLRPILTNPTTNIVGHNIKYDLKVLHRMGLSITAYCDDTLLMSYVLHNATTRHDMDSLSLKFLNHKTISFEDVAGKGAKQKTFDKVSLDVAAPYAAEDADITLQLYFMFKDKMKKDSDLYNVYKNIEQPTLMVLTEMERQGVLLDVTLLQEQSLELGIEISRLKDQAFMFAGEEFNLASPKQLQHILFEKQKLPIIKKTPKGQPSTAEAVLQELSLDYPLPKVIVEYRGLAKLKSTYTDKLPLQVNPVTHRVHTHYNQAITSTGRLSSNDPNLQNIPVRTLQGRRIRRAFIAPPSKKILAADYSQVELRIMAHISQDEGMINAFRAGVDIHQATAAEIFSVALNKVTADQRRHAKAVNFGLIYGMSAFGLSKQLHVDRASAQQYINVYFDRYPAILSYMESVRALAAKQGYISTLLGRKLIIPDITSSNAIRRKAAERAAINAPLQGTAADIIKLAMIELNKKIANHNDKIIMMMQVHDELVFEIDADYVDEASKLIRNVMETVYPLTIPLLVDIGVGDHWDEAH